MDWYKVKRRNRALLIMLLIGLIIYLLIEVLIFIVSDHEPEWIEVGSEVQWLLERPVQGDMPAPVININTATAAELEALNGIGPVKAQAIVDYREQNGLFTEAEEIMNVNGIGEATFAKLADQITVGESSPDADDIVHSTSPGSDVQTSNALYQDDDAQP